MYASVSQQRQIGQAMAASVTRHNEKRHQTIKPFLKAIETVETKNQWSNGETVTLFTGTLQGQKAEVFIKNEGGRLNLFLFVEGKTLMDRFYSQPFPVGHMFPDQGWAVASTATEEAYRTWNLATRKAVA